MCASNRNRPRREKRCSAPMPAKPVSGAAPVRSAAMLATTPVVPSSRLSRMYHLDATALRQDVAVKPGKALAHHKVSPGNSTAGMSGKFHGAGV